MSATQQDAVRVLAALVAVDLPPLSWRVSPGARFGLSAQPWSLEDEESLVAIAAWAVHLGVKPTTTREDTYVRVAVDTVVDGVRVEIFTHTDRTYTTITVPIEKDGDAT